MPKPVKIVFVLVLLIGGADATRDYFTASSDPGTAHRLGEDISFWSFVAFALCVIGYAVYRHFRPHK